MKNELFDVDQLGDDTITSLLYQLGLMNGVYAGNKFEPGAQTSYITPSNGAGAYALFQTTVNTVYVGFLSYYNPANTGKEGLLQVTNRGITRTIDTVKESKVQCFDAIVGDSGGGTAMAQPVFFVGWVFMVVGRGVLP